MRWRHEWEPVSKQAQMPVGGGRVVNPFTSRGAALKDGKLIRSTPDSHLIALDAQTGALIWERAVAQSEDLDGNRHQATGLSLTSTRTASPSLHGSESRRRMGAMSSSVVV